MSRTRKRAIYIDAESSYGTDPSADGSGYVHIPALEVGDIVDQLELLATDYFTGRMHGTAPEAGRDMAELDVHGAADRPGDGGWRRNRRELRLRRLARPHPDRGLRDAGHDRW